MHAPTICTATQYFAVNLLLYQGSLATSFWEFV